MRRPFHPKRAQRQTWKRILTADIERFVIVTGSMRSGTSLLGHLLQQQPDGKRAIAELAFDNDMCRAVVELFATVRKTIVPAIGYGDPFREVELDGPLLEALSALPGASADHARRELRARLAKEIIPLAPPGPTPSMLGIKRTSMNYEIGIIDALFRDVRLIFTVRDPRDVFVSHAKRMGATQDAGSSLLILAYALANHYMLERLARAQRAVLVVRYEDMVQEPVAQMRRILAHLDVDAAGFSVDSVLSPQVPNNSSYSASVGDGFVAGEGITRASVGRFRDFIEPELGRLVELLCAPIMATHGYAPALGELHWETGFQRHIEAMRKRCTAARISFEPVLRRLTELGVA